jgi:hypothetical protein
MGCQIWIMFISLMLLITYTVVKYRAKKILKLLEDFEWYEVNHNIKLNHWPTISGIITFSSLIFLNIHILSSNPKINELFKMVLVNKELKKRLILSSFHSFGWFVTIQIIYFEFYWRYFKIIKNYLKSLNVKNSIENFKPTKDEIIKSQQNIHQFIYFQTILSRNFDFLEFFLIPTQIANITAGIIMITIFILNNNYHSATITLIFLLISGTYFICSQMPFFMKKSIAKKIKQELNKWQQFSDDEELTIELEVLDESLNLFTQNKIVSISGQNETEDINLHNIG